MSETKTTQRVAVIGSSYAGLCFARALHTTKGKSKFQVQLFELRSQETMSEVDGSLQFYDGLSILESLELDDLYNRATQGNNRTNKSILLQGLADSLPKTSKIHYEAGVRRIHVDEESDAMLVEYVDRFLKSQTASFDLVIAADGLTSRTRALMATGSNAPFFLLGDASHTYGRELCFGLQRTRYGGSQAMAAAVTLANILGLLDFNQGTSRACRSEERLHPYTLRAWYQRRRRNTLLYCGVAFAVLWLLFFGVPRNRRVWTFEKDGEL
jgi:hypothetical protein